MSSETCRVLLIEDSDADARLIEEFLKRSGSRFSYERERTLARGLEVLETRGGDFDVVLLDLGLPDSFGFDTVMRALEADSDLPVVLLTGHADADLATKALRAGAADYLLKGNVDSELLRRSLSYVIEQARSKRELELTYKAIEDASLSILWLEADGAISGCNAAASAMLGHSAEELCALNIADIDPDYPRQVRESHWRLLGERGRLRYESRARHADGRLFPMEVAAQRVERDGRQMELALIQDLSARRAMQASLAQSDRMASVGLLAAGVAHEINNPLTYVVFNLESLGDDLPLLIDIVNRQHLALAAEAGEDRARRVFVEAAAAHLAREDVQQDIIERLEDALDGAHRVRDIVGDLKTFSRADDERVAPVSVNAALRTAANMAANELKYRAQVVKNLGCVPMVLANDGRLSQVFLNLLVNAAHAIPEGAAEHNEVRISSRYDGQHVLVEVADSGAGIPPASLERIFEPFFTTKEAGVGSGLGLAICHGIISGYGGEIAVGTELGKGTCFRIQLPICDEVDDEAALPAPDVLEPSGQRGRLLVVDDEPQICQVLDRLLSTEHEVTTARSGEQAQAILGANDGFDLILCDLMMPKVTGMELHAWLEEHHPALAASMVFITGGAFTPAARSFLSSVPNLHVEKPFAPRDIRAVVREMLGGRG
jgi:PAS domain S-box-containing protein